MEIFIQSLGKDGLKNAYSLLSGFALYLFAALIVILAVSFFIIKKKSPEKLSGFKTLAIGITVGFAVTLSLCISFLMIARLSLKGEIDANFYLLLGFFALILVYLITASVLYFTSKKAFKICNIIGIISLFIYGVVLLIVIPTASEAYKPLDLPLMYVLSFAIIILSAFLVLFFDRKKGQSSPTKSIAFAGVSIALAFALSYVKLFSLPQGGSITLASMLPLILYSYVFGAKKGVLAGVVYGILQCLQSPQIYQPMQVIIDYPVAFGVLGLSGIVKGFKLKTSSLVKFIIGASIACFSRYLCHFISGYFVFSSWAMEGYTAFTWSLVYNLYVIAELAIVLVIGCILFSSKGFNNELNKIDPVFYLDENK